MLALYVQAPFAAFRSFTAGWYRPTAAFLTPSAAYGLVLNAAGIESRRDDGLSPMTVTAFDLPEVRIAVGAAPTVGTDGPFPSVQTVFQQLHNYPVGSSGKERKEDAKGNKYNVTPVRREILVDVRGFILLDAEPWLLDRVREGLAGKLEGTRYGLPFLGDNSFLLDRFEVREGPVAAHWYCRLGADALAGDFPHSSRLTVWIDRQDMSKTTSALFAPLPEATSVPDLPPDVPGSAWTAINPPKAPPDKPVKTPKK